MIKLTAETSKGRMNTIRKEKYQATKTATVTSQCCFRQLPYWWRRHKVRRKTKIISTVNGAALILNLLRYIEMIFQKGVAKIPVEQTGKIDVLRKILNSTGDQNSLFGKSLVTNEFSSRREIIFRGHALLRFHSRFIYRTITCEFCVRSIFNSLCLIYVFSGLLGLQIWFSSKLIEF